ncbi:acyltransferase [Rhodococcus sp. NPDC127530]|uniref:acyltransferase n=1 Tax=unclassified Rhodococcus (in: high G+C Gram-positive bacteria) TaxID=192944 RepID=UPI00363188E2
MDIEIVRKHLARVVRDVVRYRIAASVLIPSPLRWRVLRLFGVQVQKSYIAPGLFVGGSGLKVFKGAVLNYECFIDATGEVVISEDVAIGPRSVILTVTHNIGEPSRRRGVDHLIKAVRVGRGSWLGGNVTLLPGAEVGEGCVIGAGSVVTGYCEPNHVYAGVPARKVRAIVEKQS